MSNKQNEEEEEEETARLGYGQLVKKTLTSYEFYWSFFVFACHLLSVFAVTFWIGMVTYPNNLHLALFITIESILFFDFLFKSLITISPYRKLQFYWIFDFSHWIGWLYFLINLLCSFPQTLLLSLLSKREVIQMERDDTYNLLLLIKLGSLWDMQSFVNEVRQRLVFLNFKIIVLLKFVENLILLIFVTHIGGCVWTLVNKYQGPGKNLYINFNTMKYKIFIYIYFQIIFIMIFIFNLFSSSLFLRYKTQLL